MIIKPWWDIFPTTPKEVVERTITEPAVVPIPAAVVSKTILKMGALPLLGGVLGGTLLARVFGGGAAPQTQEQDITQTPTVTPTVTPDLPVDVGVSPIAQALMDIITKQQLAAGAGEIDIGESAVITGDVGTSEITNITNTYPTSINIQKTITQTYPTQITKTITYTATGAAQEAKQEQGADLVTIALIAVAGLIGWQFLKGRV